MKDKYIVKDFSYLGEGSEEKVAYPKGCEDESYQDTMESNEQKVGGHEETYE